jgi:hypothetical protein
LSLLNVIPKPKKIEFSNGKSFNINNPLRVNLYMEIEDERLATLVCKVLPNQELNLKIDKRHKGYYLTVNLDDPYAFANEIAQEIKEKQEGYFLKVNDSSILIFSEFAKGLFYGIHTLDQLFQDKTTIPSMKVIDWPDVEMRCMNFEFRQSYPNFENILDYFEELAGYKVNTLLIEYEDKFPFRKYPFLRHEKYTLSEEQLEQLKIVAKSNFIDIIPLQQSFGHLEYVLKHEEFKWLRETPDDIGEVCTSKKAAFELVKELLDEVIDAHPDSKYVHLGCDEVWSICKCETCKNIEDGSKVRTFIKFVNKLINHVATRGKTPIIWHDMLAGCDEEDIKLIDKRAVVVIWLYGGSNVEKLIDEWIPRFRRNGIEVMGAPSVRCHDGRDDQNYPVVENRIENIYKWANAAAKFNLNCIISTNWDMAGSMCCPYGIFETTWYLMALSAEKYWNINVDNRDFLARFMNVFHGTNLDMDSIELENCGLGDYYRFVGGIIDKLNKHKNIGEIIRIMNEYEEIQYKLNSIKTYSFRLEMFKGNEAEMTSIKTKYTKVRDQYESVRVRMDEKLSEFLPSDMVRMYIGGRFFIDDFLHDNFYRRVLTK